MVISKWSAAAAAALVFVAAPQVAAACTDVDSWEPAGEIVEVRNPVVAVIDCAANKVRRADASELHGLTAKRSDRGNIYLVELKAVVSGPNVTTSEKAKPEITCRESRERFDSTDYASGMGHGGCGG